MAILLLLTFSTLGQAVRTPTTALSLEEQVKVKQTFYDALPFTELATAHYATAGLKTLKAEIPPTQVQNFCLELCLYQSVSVLSHAGVCSFLTNSAIEIKIYILHRTFDLVRSNL